MISNISWASYLYAISIILAIYYLVVLILYYRKDLKSYILKLNTGPILEPVRELTTEQNITDLVKSLSLEEALVIPVTELGLSIRALIIDAAQEDFNKAELQYSLQIRLQNFPFQTSNELKDSINTYIIAVCQNHSSIHLNVDEVSALWVK